MIWDQRTRAKGASDMWSTCCPGVLAAQLAMTHAQKAITCTRMRTRAHGGTHMATRTPTWACRCAQTCIGVGTHAQASSHLNFMHTHTHTHTHRGLYMPNVPPMMGDYVFIDIYAVGLQVVKIRGLPVSEHHGRSRHHHISLKCAQAGKRAGVRTKDDSIARCFYDPASVLPVHPHAVWLCAVSDAPFGTSPLPKTATASLI
jgi:hypothetical protein